MRWLFAIVIGVFGLGTAARSARAETLGAWTYEAPTSYKAVKKDTQHEYTRVTGQTFCAIAVYVPRPAGADLASDLKQEWSSLITAKFTASEVTPYPVTTTKKGLAKHVTGAKLVDAAGTYFGQVSVIRERGTVGSILLLSNSAKTITSCHPTMTALTESIGFVANAAPTSAPAPSEKPAQGSVVGQWGVESSLRDYRNGWSSGYTQYQYDLRADGTYAFKQEQKREWTQKTQFFTVEEVGTYEVDGAKLTITPKSAKGTLRDDQGNVLESSNPALEKVTYTWKVVQRTQETQLWWTPPKPTQRDGTPNGGSGFPGGYILLNPKTIYWKY